MLYSLKPCRSVLPALLTLLLAYLPQSRSYAGGTDDCRIGDRYVLGYLETVTGIDNQFDTKLTALVDSGATTSSMDARDMTIRQMPNGSYWVRFTLMTEKDGKGKTITLDKPVKRFVRVITHSDSPKRRPVIEASIKLQHHIAITTEFSLISRARFPQSILLGRNTLADLAVVDSAHEFMLDKCGNEIDSIDFHH